MLPPLVGRNRFVPGQVGFSWAPEWTAPNVASKVYISVLIVAGFLTPLVIIAVYLDFQVGMKPGLCIPINFG